MLQAFGKRVPTNVGKIVVSVKNYLKKRAKRTIGKLIHIYGKQLASSFFGFFLLNSFVISHTVGVFTAAVTIAGSRNIFIAAIQT